MSSAQPKSKLPVILTLTAVAAIVAVTLTVWATRDDSKPAAPQPEEEHTFVAADIPEPEVQEPTPSKEEPVAKEQPAEEDVAEELPDETMELAWEIEDLREQSGDSSLEELERQDKKQGSKRSKKKKQKTLKPAVLVVVTNFDQADITVNGLAYPEYYEDPKDNGMLLPAGGPYTVVVTYGANTKTYTLSLRPYETRYLVVELSGFKGAATPPPAKPTPAPAKPLVKEEEPKKEESSEEGRVTVYAKPRGDIMLDGKDMGKKTPNTIEAPAGRHEVQVKYEDGEISEKKIVRIRKGSRIKLFFRQRKNK